jgi:hypothetical protein
VERKAFSRDSLSLHIAIGRMEPIQCKAREWEGKKKAVFFPHDKKTHVATA